MSTYLLLRSTKKNAYFSSPAGDPGGSVQVPCRISRFGRHLGSAGTFCLDLMGSVFLARELVSDEALSSLCLLQVCLSFFSQISIKSFFKSTSSLIVRVNVVLNRTVVVDID